MEMMQLETELAQRRSEMKLVELDKKADIEETKGLYEHDRSIDAGGFINALRGSVRPVITYAFFGLFVATKVVIMVKVGQSGGEWTEAVNNGGCQVDYATVFYWYTNSPGGYKHKPLPPVEKRK